MFVTDKFDDKRIDILMEYYRNEIVRMQRAKPPYIKMEEKEEKAEPIRILTPEKTDKSKEVEKKEDKTEVKTEKQKAEVKKEEKKEVKADKEITPEKVIEEEAVEEIDGEIKNYGQNVVERRVHITPTDNLSCEIISLEEARKETKEPLEKKQSKDNLKATPYVIKDIDVVSDKKEREEYKNPYLTEYDKSKQKRVAFKKGLGAWGEFKPYEKNNATTAFFLQNPMQAQNAFMRFSSDIGENEADTTRCQRSLALKIFDKENQCDLLFGSLPVGFANKSSQYFDFFNSMLRNSKTGIFDYNAMWKFVIDNPDSMDAMLYYWSDLGTPSSFRSMTYYSCPMILEDRNGEETAAKFILSPAVKQKPLSLLEAQEIAGCDIDYLVKDLYFTLKNNNRFIMELGVQMIPKNRWNDFDIDIFNPQCLWRVSEIPVTPLGMLNINRNCENHERDMAKSMFVLSNLCEGIKLPQREIYEEAANTMKMLAQKRTGVSFDTRQNIFAPCEIKGTFKSPVEKCSERLNRMNERESRRLRENLLQSMETLNGDTLEKVLLMMTDLDFSFGKALMNMTEA